MALVDKIIALAMYDEHPEIMTDDEIDTLMGSIKDDIDRQQRVVSGLSAELARVKCHIKELNHRKKVIENAIPRIEERLLNVLKAGETKMLCGNSWDLVLTSRKSKRVKPDLDAFDLYNELGPHFVKVSYDIKKNDLGEAAKVNPETFGKYIEENVKESVKFKNH